MNKTSLIALVAALALAQACAQQEEPIFDGYCGENPAVCVAGVVVGGLVISELSKGGGSSKMVYPTPTTVSDRALKRDIRPVAEHASGLTAYAFRYLGGKQTFVGFLAQDLAADPRYAHAVAAGADGYLRIDYSKLDAELYNGAVMAAAGEAAVQRALTR